MTRDMEAMLLPLGIIKPVPFFHIQSSLFPLPTSSFHPPPSLSLFPKPSPLCPLPSSIFPLLIFYFPSSIFPPPLPFFFLLFMAILFLRPFHTDMKLHDALIIGNMQRWSAVVEWSSALGSKYWSLVHLDTCVLELYLKARHLSNIVMLVSLYFVLTVMKKGRLSYRSRALVMFFCHGVLLTALKNLL